jgi:hypothetical protein
MLKLVVLYYYLSWYGTKGFKSFGWQLNSFLGTLTESGNFIENNVYVFGTIISKRF